MSDKKKLSWEEWGKKKAENSAFESEAWSKDEEENRKKAQESLSGKKTLEKIRKMFSK